MGMYKHQSKPIKYIVLIKNQRIATQTRDDTFGKANMEIKSINHAQRLIKH
jgi:hypothetical protein